MIYMAIWTWLKFGSQILVHVRLFTRFTVHSLIPPKQRQLSRLLLTGTRPGTQSQGLSHWVALAYSFYTHPASSARIFDLTSPRHFQSFNWSSKALRLIHYFTVWLWSQLINPITQVTVCSFDKNIKCSILFFHTDDVNHVSFIYSTIHNIIREKDEW